MDDNFEVSAQDFLDYVIINNIEVAKLSTKEREQLMKEIQFKKTKEFKRSFVLKHHLTPEGNPRAITAPSSEKGLWYTQDPRNLNNKIRGKSEEIVIDKLFDIYSSGTLTLNYSIEAWYEIGVEHRKRKTNPRQSTLERHERTKKSYFTEELLQSDVRSITSSELWDFIKNTQEAHDLSLSETKQLKGTLNLIFSAAADPETGCRPNNPLATLNPTILFKNNAKAINNEQPKKKTSAFSEKQIQSLREIFMHRIETSRHTSYERCKYALMGLLASYTGMRASEFPALRWEDIKENYIHLHQMQTRNDGEHGEDRFEIVPWLKEEKGWPRGGRMVPFITPKIKETLDLIKDVQKDLGIESEWVFPDTDSLSYERSLYKLCKKKLGYNISNNHAFRKGFNLWMLSNGLNVAERAKILGHSTAVNLSRYTVTTDDWINETIQKVFIS